MAVFGKKETQQLFKSIQTSLRAAVIKVRTQAEFKQIGDYAVELIKLRTRLGYGVGKGAGGLNKVKLAKLAESTKKVRSGELSFITIKTRPTRNVIPIVSRDMLAQFKKLDSLHPTTTWSTSNLTHTGQMLESLKTIQVKAESVVIGVTGERNIQLAKYAADGSKTKPIRPPRPFLALTILELTKINNFLRQIIAKQLKSFK